MGASQSSSSSVTEEAMASFLSRDFPEHRLEAPLVPGSGRMMRTYRLRNNGNGAMVVLKTMLVAVGDDVLEAHEKELKKIRTCLKGTLHVVPMLKWRKGAPVNLPRDATSGSSFSVGSGRGQFVPIYLWRPHFYTTLSDRLASRPFLSQQEKLWIIYQLLTALDHMHSKGISHGHVTCENLGLTSWNWVVLTDIASYKASHIPNNDPSDYIYYYQDTKASNNREKKCYLAPERLYSSDSSSRSVAEGRKLTAAMDVFGAGCVLMETMLNGERAMDLGDLLEYASLNNSNSSSSNSSSSSQNGTPKLTSGLQQKLNKIESSALRAACKRMLHFDPRKRLSAREYLERLTMTDTSAAVTSGNASHSSGASTESSQVMPACFGKTLYPVFRQLQTDIMTADARIAVAAANYGKVVRSTIGVIDKEGEEYLSRLLLGPPIDGSRDDQQKSEEEEKKESEPSASNRRPDNAELMAETEQLLKQLDALMNSNDSEISGFGFPESKPSSTVAPTASRNSDTDKKVESVQPSPSSLLIFLQLILSSMRYVQRPSSKLVALQLLRHINKYLSDDARLQRSVPACVSLLQDQDSSVKALSIQVLTATLCTIQSFPPSDSMIFPRYIFKNLSQVMTTEQPTLVVRVALAECIGPLAEAALRFLDISHALRLYEAVGGSGNVSGDDSTHGAKRTQDNNQGVFTEDVARLLDGPGSKDSDKITPSPVAAAAKVTADATSTDAIMFTSTYDDELESLQETVSRWVVMITTDVSEHSAPKHALLRDLPRLCNVFGREGVTARILPQVLAFLNDRQDWQLRVAVCEYLPSVCTIIGRAATERFVLPCVEVALVDGEELVMSAGLSCLASLVEMRLISQTALVGSVKSDSTNESGSEKSLVEKYAPLLLYPSADVREAAVSWISTICRTVDFADLQVFLLPLLRPFIRFEPTLKHLQVSERMTSCLVPALTKEDVASITNDLESRQERFKKTGHQWTALGDSAETENVVDLLMNSTGSMVELRESQMQEETPSEVAIKPAYFEHVEHYLDALHKHKKQMAGSGDPSSPPAKLHDKIEGSLKVAASYRYPNQKYAELIAGSLPQSYAYLRDKHLENPSSHAREFCALESISTVPHVFGVPILDPRISPISNKDREKIVNLSEDPSKRAEEAKSLLSTTRSAHVDAALEGVWKSSTRLDALDVETSLAIARLNGLRVPPLPPSLGLLRDQRGRPSLSNESKTSVLIPWKPKVDALAASSCPVKGHSGPITRMAVSHDQSFFVSASHDGSCKVWELRQIRDSVGVLDSCLTYDGHGASARINDVATVENTHSVVSGDSVGSVHIWRVDTVLAAKATLHSLGAQSDAPRVDSSGKRANDPYRVSGSTDIRTIDPAEGEIMAVSHFNGASQSVVAFATQGGIVHSWDLRCAVEPFALKHNPDMGYLTSMAVGKDRTWVMTGTSQGYISLWDVRFPILSQLRQHPSEATVNRLTVANVNAGYPRPVVFMACGENEGSVVDVVDGSCRKCFRVLDPSLRHVSRSSLPASFTRVPLLSTVPMGSRTRGGMPTMPRRKVRIHSSCSHQSMHSIVGVFGSGVRDFVISGGDDRCLRYWDVSSPNACYTVSGFGGPRDQATFETAGQGGAVVLCRQQTSPSTDDIESSRVPRSLQRGPVRPDNSHKDSIMDIQMIDSPMEGILSCSRDGFIKLWR